MDANLILTDGSKLLNDLQRKQDKKFNFYPCDFQKFLNWD
jgi:hypothetical protein